MKKEKGAFLILFVISCIIIPAGYLFITKIDKKNKTEEAVSIEAMQGAENKTENEIAQSTIDEEENTNDSQKLNGNKEDEVLEFQKVEDSYFDDALFIGDSRTLGISEYGTLKNATFFASSGMSVYNIGKDTVSVPNIGKVTLEQLLNNHKYGKIYVMLGINELGYDMKQSAKKYGELIQKIKALQPDAIVYIEANLHVSKARNDKDNLFNNANINKYNDMLKQFADDKSIFYIDVNPRFDDENGNLRQDYTQDNTHPLGKYYADWCEWFKENAICTS